MGLGCVLYQQSFRITQTFAQVASPEVQSSEPRGGLELRASDLEQFIV